ncbi:MAG: molybdate ABC transporter substrate-binding protein [Specibacter sp.]
MTFYSTKAASLKSAGATRLRIGAVVGLLALGLAGCAPAADTAPGGASNPASSAPAELSGTLNVYAAASLKQTFTELATQYEQANPKVTVSLSFDGSSTLVTQIKEGAPADVFASADQANIKKLSDAGLVRGTPVNFASNVLTLVVPPGNPANIKTFADAAKAGVKLVICAPQVPCGAASQSDAKMAGITLSPVSEELNVTSVLGKVTSGEADAGLVYVTDAKSAGSKVLAIPLGLDKPTVNLYPITAVNTSKVPDIAQGFMSLVTGTEGQKVLQDAGFGAP